MNKFITVVLSGFCAATVILFFYSLEFFNIPVFDFKSNLYLVSYFLLTCVIMALKTISDKNTIKYVDSGILAVWRLEGEQFMKFVQHENYMKKILVKALYGVFIILLLVSIYPLITFETLEVTAIVSGLYGLILLAAILVHKNVNKAIKNGEIANSCDLVLTTNSLVYNGEVKYSWNDFAIDLISADVVNDGSIDGVLSIMYRKYGKRLFSLQIPLPPGKRDEAVRAAIYLKMTIRNKNLN